MMIKPADFVGSYNLRKWIKIGLIAILLLRVVSFFIPTPGYSNFYCDLASAIVKKDPSKKDRIITYYKKAIYHNPQNPRAYYELGTFYRQHEEYDNAVECYKKFVAFGKYSLSELDAFTAIGLDYLLRDDYLNAIIAFRHVYLDHWIDETYHYMGLAYFGLHDTKGIFQQIKNRRRWQGRIRKETLLRRGKEFINKYYHGHPPRKGKLIQ